MAPGSNSDIVLMAIAEEQAKQGLMADALQAAERISDVNFRQRFGPLPSPEENTARCRML